MVRLGFVRSFRLLWSSFLGSSLPKRHFSATTDYSMEEVQQQYGSSQIVFDSVVIWSISFKWKEWNASCEIEANEIRDTRRRKIIVCNGKLLCTRSSGEDFKIKLIFQDGLLQGVSNLNRLYQLVREIVSNKECYVPYT